MIHKFKKKSFFAGQMQMGSAATMVHYGPLLSTMVHYGPLRSTKVQYGPLGSTRVHYDL